MAGKRILVIGAAGQIGRHLCRLGSEAGLDIRAMIRDHRQAGDFDKMGCRPVVADLEKEFAECFDGVEQVVFTAGSGAKTGADKTLLVDLWGAWKSIAAARANQCQNFLMVSALRAADPDQGPEKIRHYLVAKHIADERLKESGLGYTILRPGRFHNGEENHNAGMVTVHPSPEEAPWWTHRENVARFALECLKNPDRFQNETVDMADGATPIGQLFS